jgi:uncharacterized protein YdiU (UPF0061 family)
VFSSIDTSGRYAYGNQPGIAQWNLARLAEALLPLLDTDEPRAVEIAQAALERFRSRFQDHFVSLMRARLGLVRDEAGDGELVDGLLEWMQATRADFTNTFRRLARPADAEALAREDAAFSAWHAQWRTRLGREAHDLEAAVALMQRSSPAIVPRNHKVEEALASAVQGDVAPLDRLVTALRTPYDHANVPPEFASPAPESDGPYRTFCGT